MKSNFNFLINYNKTLHFPGVIPSVSIYSTKDAMLGISPRLCCENLFSHLTLCVIYYTIFVTIFLGYYRAR
jgi:hypothetical protein